jgi:hypothetical protein
MKQTCKLKKPFPSLILIASGLCYLQAQAAEPADISGDWEIHSSVGGATPITVNCTLVQDGTALGGTCTPVMENAQPSELDGETSGSTAVWGYDVVFNGNPGRVDFTADSVSDQKLAGTLSLSGTEAPFEAVRK